MPSTTCRPSASRRAAPRWQLRRVITCWFWRCLDRDALRVRPCGENCWLTEDFASFFASAVPCMLCQVFLACHATVAMALLGVVRAPLACTPRISDWIWSHCGAEDWDDAPRSAKTVTRAQYSAKAERGAGRTLQRGALIQNGPEAWACLRVPRT